MTEQALTLLRQFYPVEGLFLKGFSNFSVSTSSITGTFNVPKDAAYSIIPLNYVTAEQYVRCFSQLSYGLMYLLSIYHDGMTLYGSPAEFERLMCSGQMWYRRMNIRFIKVVEKGNDFTLQMELEGIRRVRSSVIASLVAKEPVRVKSEFVAPF